MTTILMICILTLPIQFLIPVPETIRQTIVDISVAIGSITATMALFSPKAVALYVAFYPPAEKVSDNHPTVMDVLRSSSKKGGQVAPSSKGRQASMTKLQLLSEAANLPKLPIDDQIAVCQEQLGLWKVKMMRLNERMSGDSRNSSHSRSMVALDVGLPLEKYALPLVDNERLMDESMPAGIPSATKLNNSNHPTARAAFQDSFMVEQTRDMQSRNEVVLFEADDQPAF